MIKILKKNKKIVMVVLVLLLCVYLYKEHSNKKVEMFDDGVAELMFFSAEWCRHCQDFQPVWSKLVTNMEKEPYKNKIILKNYDNDNENDSKTFKKYSVKQFPTIILKKEGGTTVEFDGKTRDIETLTSFIDDNLNM